MSLRAITFALMLLSPVAGCRLIDLSTADGEPRLSSDVLSALESQLKRDSWQRDPQWTLLDTTVMGRPVAADSERNRWRFGVPIVGNLVSRLDERSRTTRDPPNRKAAESTALNESGWNSRTPAETLEQAGIDSRTEGSRYLAALAETDGIVGWNAAILWAQRDPLSAKRAAAILQNLVTDPPYYDPQTGKRVRLPKAADSLVEKTDTGRGERLEGKTGATALGDIETLAELVKKIRKSGQAADAKSKALESIPASLWTRLQKYVSDTEVRSRARRVSAEMQSAAAEAWCRVLAAGVRDPRAALFPPGRMLKRVDVPMLVRAELFRGLASWVPPADIPRLEIAIQERVRGPGAVHVKLRRAAIDACLIHATAWREGRLSKTRFDFAEQTDYDPAFWPETILNCQHDPDPYVRETFGRWTAIANHPRAVEILERQYVDGDSRVRHGSLLSLGMTGTDAARRRLRARAARGNNSDRAQAVKGLARWGIAELEQFSSERLEPVQKAVAISLSDLPSERGGRILQHYFEKASERVQFAGLRSIERWPDALAVPVLLHAMGYGTNQSARLAYRSLSRRQLERGLEFDASFSSQQIQPIRAKAAESLAFRFNLPLEWEPGAPGNHRQTKSHINAQYLGEVKQDLKTLADGNDVHRIRAAIERLKHVPDEDVAVIERLVVESRRAYPDSLFVDVLAEKDESYRALKDLYDEDPLVQRRGMHVLARLGAKRPLSRLVVRRMLTRLRERRDRVLWSSAVRAVLPDATDECEQLATEAAFHHAPTVRALACMYFARHPNPLKSDILLQLMNDEHDRGVQLAAIRAAGFSRSPELISGAAPSSKTREKQTGKSSRNPAGLPYDRRELLGLQKLMVSSNATIRHAAVVSLARLGDELGYRELTRMSYSASVEIRKQAFELMGESGQQRFIDLMIDRGWGERNDEIRRVILRSLEEIVPAGERPVGLSTAKRYDAQIELWAKSRDAALRGGATARPNRTASDRRNRSNGRERTGFSTRMAR